MKKQKTVSLFAIAMILAGPVASTAKSYQIPVSQFVEHPALDAVLKKLQDYFLYNSLKVEYIISR